MSMSKFAGLYCKNFVADNCMVNPLAAGFEGCGHAVYAVTLAPTSVPDRKNLRRAWSGTFSVPTIGALSLILVWRVRADGVGLTN